MKSQKPPRYPPGKPALHGLRRSPRNPHINWMLDVDYAHKLSAEERAWLAQFLDEYYLAARRKPGNVHDAEGLRTCWRECKQRQRAQCAMSYGHALRESPDMPPAEEHIDAEEETIALLDNKSAARRRRKKKGMASKALEDALTAFIDAKNIEAKKKN